MLPEEKARVKIDKQLSNAGWDIVARDEYVPFNASAVKEALMQGNKESDYLLLSITVSNFCCMARDRLPISSRKSVPPSASSILPTFCPVAPVKAPLT